MTNTTEARCDICQRRDHKPGTYQGHAYAAPAAAAPDFASMTAGARVRFVPAPGAPAIEGELIRAPKLRHSGTGYLLSIRTLEDSPRTFMRNSEDVTASGELSDNLTADAQ